jgi:hypothetical protein
LRGVGSPEPAVVPLRAEAGRFRRNFGLGCRWPGKHLNNEKQRQGGPGVDGAGADAGVGGGDVRGEGCQNPGGEGEAGGKADAPDATLVVDHDHGGDDEHAVDAERQGVGDVGSFSTGEGDMGHVGVRGPRGDGGHCSGGEVAGGPDSLVVVVGHRVSLSAAVVPCAGVDREGV